MSVCPWCKAKNPPGNQACLRCGKRAGDHPSVTGRTVDDGFGDESEIANAPALDLDLAPTRGAPVYLFLTAEFQVLTDEDFVAGGVSGLRRGCDDGSLVPIVPST